MRNKDEIVRRLAVPDINKLCQRLVFQIKGIFKYTGTKLHELLKNV